MGAALAWQIVFFLIARDPLRHRPLMIPSVIEKFTYGVAVGLLVMQERMHPADMIFGGIDLLLGILFVVAYFNTAPNPLTRYRGPWIRARRRNRSPPMCVSSTTELESEQRCH